MKRALPALGAACLLVTGGEAVRAEDKPLWELGVGVGALSLPYWRGASESRSWLLPVPYFVYRGEFLRSDREGTRAVLLDADRVDFDISVAAGAPASSDKTAAREGMPDLDPTLEVGPRLNWRVGQGSGWKVDLRLPVRAVVLLKSHPRSLGWFASPVLNLDVEVERGNLGVQAGPLYGGRRLHEYYYGVAPVYATATRPAYSAAAGYAGWQATLAFSRRFGSFWFGSFLRHDVLSGAVFEASPLVGERRQWTYGIALSWIFAQSEQRVPDRER